MNSTATSMLKRRFAEAFYPSARPQPKSKRGRSTWLEVIHVEDDLVGPIYSVAETGGCAYVYAREDGLLGVVDCPDVLRDRLRQWHAELVEVIDRFVPTSTAEAVELGLMRQWASSVWEVAELACEIEADRYGAEAHSNLRP